MPILHQSRRRSVWNDTQESRVSGRCLFHAPAKNHNDRVDFSLTVSDCSGFPAFVVRRLLPAALFLAGCSALPACATAYSSGESTQIFGRDFAKLIAAIPPERVNNEPREKALQGLELIGKSRFDEASALLNSALRLDPSNSYLQFFNAFDYHMMARGGDTQKFALAEQGYALAIKFDTSNWVAHYFLGTLYFEQRNFSAAQRELAEVLLFLEDDQEVLFRMVAASYYSHDPVTAAACLDRLRALNPQDAQVLRLSAIISAAIGRAEDASHWLALYQASHPDADELASAQERVNHWKVVYQKGLTSGNASGMSVPLSGPDALSFDKPHALSGGMMPAQFTFPTQQPGQPLPGQMQPLAPAVVAAPVVASDGQMVLVDVVLMYTEDTLTSNKGVNLLNALTLQFGSSTAPAFSKTFSGSNTDGVSTATTAVTRAITVPALTYSMNIANAGANLNEVLARPTLAALNGMKSEFFSGVSLNAAVVSNNATGGGSVQIEKEIGVKLTITPVFMPKGKVQMSVVAERTFLKPPSQNVGFTYKVEVTKVMINANVMMNLGETLVLGGLSEKETTNTREGVPFLQDIPGLQYLFSTKSTSDYQHSVLMLITPRLPQYTYRSDEVLLAEAGSSTDVAQSVKELRARYGDWFSPYPNMSSVFHQLDSSSIYREFRTGDVTLEKWDKQVTSMQRLKKALSFLFY
ncbi:MAG TPA: hypothetical protein DE312_06745 [Gallionella sp.]|nr:hypothetical protein [Gallionella sp.]OGS67922.1 MAG: hypothetical protein A2Z87_13000 [Gallionellales bacterium GWA2_54_124]HCI52997.1 hypothetical protein [Gallionella sp.]